MKPYTVATQSIDRREGADRPLLPPAAREHDRGGGPRRQLRRDRRRPSLRRGAKANHLAYLGDGDIGEGANIGAGTIFCNYDGFKKHKTEIGAGAFIGSDSQLVAPVRIGAGAYVATGTTVTRDVPDDALAIARVRQENKEGYADRLKSRLAAAKKKAE